MFKIHRGTNISHWLSQSKARGEQRQQWFTNEDVKRIRDWGFDHIRLPVDEEQLWAADGQRETEAFDLLNHALDWCADAGLRVIVDLHILRSHYFNDENEPALYREQSALDKFADLWRDLSAALHERSTDLVAYELLNEAVARNPEDWNRVSGYVFDVVRQLEPERTIVLGSNEFAKTHTFPDLKIPDDQHLILTFHYYEPMFITHYKASWNLFHAYKGPIQYPGKSVPDAGLDELHQSMPGTGDANNHFYDRDVMKQQIMVAYQVAQNAKLPLYCGEFGVIEATPLEIKQRWFADLISIFDELGIAWANWDYKGGFGLIDRYTGADKGILDVLLPN